MKNATNQKKITSKNIFLFRVFWAEVVFLVSVETGETKETKERRGRMVSEGDGGTPGWTVSLG